MSVLREETISFRDQTPTPFSRRIIRGCSERTQRAVCSCILLRTDSLRRAGNFGLAVRVQVATTCCGALCTAAPVGSPSGFGRSSFSKMTRICKLQLGQTAISSPSRRSSIAIWNRSPHGHGYVYICSAGSKVISCTILSGLRISGQPYKCIPQSRSHHRCSRLPFWILSGWRLNNLVTRASRISSERSPVGSPAEWEDPADSAVDSCRCRWISTRSTGRIRLPHLPRSSTRSAEH